MPSLIQSSLAILALSSSALGAYSIDKAFKFDVHSHVVPPIYKEALIKAKYPVDAATGLVFTDGFPVPDWTLANHIATMNTNGVNYSTISISAPGANFYAGQKNKMLTLVRSLNDAMASYTTQYPTRIGAMCILPLPYIEASIAEIVYCLDTLKFDGVGLYTNADGTYLGDRALDPVFDLLNARGATVFVHPSKPCSGSVSLGYPDPMIEYPFESVRAMENLLLTGQRSQYSNMSIIFPHGGGALPYLATRIAGLASLPFMGGLSVPDSLNQFKGYLFDTASSTSVVQLIAMKQFFGSVSGIVTGTDFPYVPQAQAAAGLASTKANGQFTDDEMGSINNANAFRVFPKVAAKLGFAIV
ncbi:Uncharacterized protein BP5553_07205 [Venustampulla echinocandica]|uniref:6-methylsalicylate decarboxylase n=1 Tax=Venustampulla echinocandica TaxID=2656787 RepID=A0A370TIT1_9HELO|nr:Uncharacterized protein BP5553_07205 [Venustampulla echinocandica]RDL35274.1 Uncharacterized protein BP5553_07205 [Venustampulla echinocandica]